MTTSTLSEVLKQMVEALETAWTYDEDNADGYYFEAIEAGKRAIVKLESQEPVAWISPKGHIHFDPYLDSAPLYTHPPQRTWVGLTDERREQLIQKCWREYIAGKEDGTTFGEWMSVATEAELKEKNS